MQNPQEIEHNIQRFCCKNKNNSKDHLLDGVNGIYNSETPVFVYSKQRSKRQISVSLQECWHSMFAPWAGKK